MTKFREALDKLAKLRSQVMLTECLNLVEQGAEITRSDDVVVVLRQANGETIKLKADDYWDFDVDYSQLPEPPW